MTCSPEGSATGVGGQARHDTAMPSWPLPFAPQHVSVLQSVTAQACRLPVARISGCSHWPALHTSPAAQAFPQAPQFAAEVCVSMHALPHVVFPLGQAHCLLWQVWPFWQTLLHAPQCVFKIRSIHPLPQSSCPLGQVHLPPTHVFGPRQALLHAPQCWFEDAVSTQPSPQKLCAAGQAQIPCTHVRGKAQGFPQAPQFVAEVCTSTHAPSQNFPPLGHWQAPLMQVRPSLQALLQAPQCALLALRSAQASPQSLCPLGQILVRQEPSKQSKPFSQSLSCVQTQWLSI